MDNLSGRINIDGAYIRPKAAEEKMKLAEIVCHTVWIYGVCGSGKTSFVADYLKNREYSYYSAQKNIAEQVEIPDFKDKMSIVVIDDLYGIVDKEIQIEWFNCISKIIEQKNIWLILISRSKVPTWLQSLFIRHVFYYIEQKNLFLTNKEIENYMKLCNLKLNDNQKQEVINIGKGYPLWYRIYAIEALGHQEQNNIIENVNKNVFDYLNIHVYDQWDTEIRDTLMKLSILRKFDLDMAVYMTGNSNVNILLKQAEELGNFISIENGVWKIQKAMCNSMIQRIDSRYNLEYIRELYSRAGNCFRIKNNMVQALYMYEKAKDNTSIAELLIQNAKENPSSGYYYEMKYYYLKLPKEFIVQSVELMGAMSMLQSILMNEEESEMWYEELKAFADKQTGMLKKEANNKLRYLDIGLPHRGSVNLIKLMKNAATLLLQRKIKIEEFAVTSNLPSLMNGGKDFCEWSKKEEEFGKGLGKIVSLVLGKYGKGLVNIGLAESGFEKGRDNYEVESLAVRGRMEAETGGKIELCFVGTALISWLSIFTDHIENALATIDGFLDMAQKENVSAMLIKNIEAFKCRIYLYEGKTKDVEEWLQEAPNEMDEFFTMERFRYLTKIRIYIMNNRFEEANLLLEKMNFYVKKMKRTYVSIEVKLLKAILFYRMGNDEWKNLLQETITAAEEYHFVRIFTREGAALMPLLNNHEFIWYDEQFKRQVKSETNKMAKMYPNYLYNEQEQSDCKWSENAINILRLQAKGKTIEEIANELSISITTVKYHNKENYKKLGVKNKTEAINVAKNKKII